MAELDNFFAKKDKKKKGKKTKKFVGTNPSSIAKALEVTTPPPGESDKTKKEALIDIPSNNTADDEWREVEENEEKDLEGLKVRSLRVDDTGGEDAVEKEEGNDNHGEAELMREAGSGGTVWQVLPAKMSSEQEVEPETEKEPEEEPKEETPPPSSPVPVKSAAYVPPNRRNQPQGACKPGGPSRGPGMGGRRKDAPPDLCSSEAFPTLGGN